MKEKVRFYKIEINNVKSIVKTISKLRLDFLNATIENLSSLAYDKYGHLVIIDLIENWGREYCNNLINNFINKINNFNKVIYGYAICKKIFLLYYKEKVRLSIIRII